MPSDPKSGALYMRIGETDMRMLDAISDRWGEGRSSAVRRLIRERHAEMFGEEPSRKQRPKRTK